MRAVFRLCLALSFVCFAQTRVRADEIARPAAEHADEWQELGPGLRYLHRTTTTPASAHVLVIDLSVPGVRIRTTPYDERWRTVSEYAEQNHLAAATNGGFWGVFQRAEGVTAGGGERWPDGHDDAEVGFFAVTRDGRAWISPPEEELDRIAPARLSEAVSGEPLLVRTGRMDVESLDAFGGANQRHPRTSIGVSRDGTKVFLIVVDGRQGFSRGMTLYELSRLFVELGAWYALNLDGGGSSAMYVAERGGIVNSPSGGRWEARLGMGPEETRSTKQRTRRREDGVEEVFVRGNEREVMNHIGVVIPVAPAPERTEEDDVPSIREERTDTVVVSPPRPPKLLLGQSREVLYPIAMGLAVFVPIAGLIVWFVKRRKKKR